MDKKMPVIPAVCLFVANAVLAAMVWWKDGIVINYGIRAYGAARLSAVLAVTACAVWTAVSAWRYARRKKKAAEAAHEARVEQMGLDKKELTEDGRRQLYRELADFGMKKWSGMDGIGRLIRQLDSMDEYQSEMGRLLDQTEYLKQRPAEIVQKVEDSMYINVRKLLNYMRIVQTKSPGVMEAKIAECEAKNAGLLKKTDDFVVAVVSYVNGDIAVGEEEKARKSVDEYMYVVLQAIELPETRLQ